MDAVVLVIHLMLALALISVVLIQQSEGGGLGIGGGSGGMGGFATARGTANLLTRTTSILAFGFLITSISLALIAENQAADTPQSVLEMADEPVELVPAERDPAVAGDDEQLKDPDTVQGVDITEDESDTPSADTNRQNTPKSEPAPPISE